MNRELMARVRDRIAEVGNEHCNMGWWVLGHGRGGDLRPGTVTGSGEIACRTTACIAGHAVAVWQGSADSTMRIQTLAMEALGLDVNPPLFSLEAWPKHYQQVCFDEGDAKGMLAILDDILDGKLDPNTLRELTPAND